MAEDFPGDAALLELQADFMNTAKRTYLRTLQDLKPGTLKKSGVMPRALVLEFFDACNTRMGLPETLETLGAYYVATKKMPNELIIGMQKEMLETLGFEREYGCACLSNLGQDYPNDPALGQGMQAWAASAQNACRLAVARADPALQPDSQQMQEMASTQQEAMMQLETMDAKDQASFQAKMQKRVDVFQKLNAADRLRYVNKLPKADKLDFVKCQIIMMRQMQQMQSQMGNMTTN